MRQELQDKLFEKYPKIFAQKDLPKTETCMCWGICVPDEWYDLIDSLCESIQVYVDNHEIDQIEATQVKTKFGTLCFYINCYDHKFINGAISFAQRYSNKINFKKY